MLAPFVDGCCVGRVCCPIIDVVDVFGSDSRRGHISKSKQAATGVACLQHGGELLLQWTTVEEFGWGTKQKHVGRGFALELLGSLVVGGVLEQLGLDHTKVIQLKIGAHGFYSADFLEVDADLVDLQVERSTACHEKLLTYLLDGGL